MNTDSTGCYRGKKSHDLYHDRCKFLPVGEYFGCNLIIPVLLIIVFPITRKILGVDYEYRSLLFGGGANRQLIPVHYCS